MLKGSPGFPDAGLGQQMKEQGDCLGSLAKRLSRQSWLVFRNRVLDTQRLLYGLPGLRAVTAATDQGGGHPVQLSVLWRSLQESQPAVK